MSVPLETGEGASFMADLFCPPYDSRKGTKALVNLLPVLLVWAGIESVFFLVAYGDSGKAAPVMEELHNLGCLYILRCPPGQTFPSSGTVCLPSAMEMA